MKGKKKRKASLSFIIFTILVPLLFLIPTAWANSQINISFDPCPNEPPARPINIYPSDGATDIEIPVTLQVSVYDESSSTVDVYFYNGLDNASIGVDYNVSADWSTATAIWSGLQDGTNYSWYVVVNDSEYENTSQIWTFITESSSSSSSSSSTTYTYYGGDSEDDDSPTISDIYYIVAGPITEAVIGDIPTGETREITLEKSNGISIGSIYFTPAVDLTNVKITMEKLADKPENITTAPTETKFVYAYVDIELTADNESIEKDEIKSLIIIFKVNLTWITENNMDKEIIALMRYHNNEWQNITTTILSEDETYVYYKIEINGTSIFAIVGNEVIELPPARPDEPSGTEEERTQLLLIIALIVSITTIALATASIYKRRQIYYMRSKLNNVHNIELKVDELLSRLNNKEIKKRKTGTKPKKKKVTKKQGKNP